MTAASSEPHTRLPALDGLRGVAILLVLFFHTTFIASTESGGALLHGFFRNFGWTGVDLFFVLSGFLITGILWDARGAAPDAGRGRVLRHFYARRALRIFPVYYAYLAIVFALGDGVDRTPLPSGRAALSYWVYLQNFATAAAGDWSHSRLLNLFWSLAVEEHFYLVWPWVVFAVRRRETLMRITVAAAVLSLGLRVALVTSGASPVAIYVLTPARLDALAAGAFVALAARGPGGLTALATPARLGAALATVGVVAVVLVQRGFSYKLAGTATVGLSLLALGFASALVLCAGAPSGSWLGRVLGGRALRTFGRTSYTLYVIHQAVFVLSTRWLVDHVLRPHAPGMTPLGVQLCVYALTIGASLALAEVTWRIYERPLLGLKRRFPMDVGRETRS